MADTHMSERSVPFGFNVQKPKVDDRVKSFEYGEFIVTPEEITLTMRTTDLEPCTISSHTTENALTITVKRGRHKETHSFDLPINADTSTLTVTHHMGIYDVWMARRPE